MNDLTTIRSHKLKHLPNAQSRRDFLFHSANGFGSLALGWLLSREAVAAENSPRSGAPVNPLAAKPGHLPARAEAVIFMFMVGGPSQVDLFDPKPQLEQRHGEPLPKSFGQPVSQFTKGDTPLLRSTRKFAKHGASGMDVSDLMPNLAQCVDDIAFIRSCWSTSIVHAPAMYELHSGRTTMGYPSLGSWVTYGLGSVNDNLPAYCVLTQPEGLPEGGAPCWGSGFLPALYQGTRLRRGSSPIVNLQPPAGMDQDRQRRMLDFIQRMNAEDSEPDDTELAARVASYELAFRMQQYAPEAVDLSQETAGTKASYGLDDARTADFGTRCLLARRLVERGVRFVQLYSGGGPLITQWDAHDDLNSNHEKMCGHVDRPVAALIRDLKQRGLFDTTLVVWASEFGRTPMSQGGKGRDHNPYGFTMWLAGGGVKGGIIHGATDEFGLRAVTNPVSVNDFHATILHLIGLDHERLIFRHNARDERLTDVAGRVIEQVIA
jgi:hypothetical protein